MKRFDIVGLIKFTAIIILGLAVLVFAYAYYLTVITDCFYHK